MVTRSSSSIWPTRPATLQPLASGAERREKCSYSSSSASHNSPVRSDSGPGGPAGQAAAEPGRCERRAGGPVVVDPSALASIADVVSRAPEIAIDIETTGLDPILDQVRLLQIATPSEVFVIDLPKVGGLGPLVDALRSSRWVGHNLAFDIAFLKHQYGVAPSESFDSMIASKLLAKGEGLRLRGAHTLQTLIAKTLGVEIAKDEQVSDWSGDLTPRQIEYAKADVRYLLELSKVLRARLNRERLDAVAAVEFSVIVPLVDMRLAGVKLDHELWRLAAAEAQEEAIALRAQVEHELGIENIESPSQVRQGLCRFGVDVDKTNKQALSAHSAHPVVARLQRYRTVSRYASNSGQNIMRAASQYPDGRIRPELDPLAANTGRFACRNPNLQQVPKDSSFRACIVAGDGKRLVAADYSAIELRVAAKIIGDCGLSRVFFEGQDPHAATAAALLSKPAEDVTKSERSRAKPVNFGFMFGMGVPRFLGYAAADFGVTFTPEEAREVRARFLRAYPGVARWHRRTAATMEREVRTLSGRARQFPNRKDGYSERLNMPIQGTAADGMKRAIAILHPRLAALDARMVLTIHDELLVEANGNNANEVRRCVEMGMVEGMAEYLDPIPVEVVAKIRDSWAE